MTINELLNLINPLTNGSNQFTIQSANMNTNDGKQYYDNLINLHVQMNYGIYAICNSDNHQILYIGKGGTIQNNGTFKNQNINGRLKADKEKNLKYIDLDFENKIEQRISSYIQNNFSFCVFRVDKKEDRLFWETKIIATIAQSGIRPTLNWPGNSSPKSKIKQNGLWQIQGLMKPPLTLKEFEELKEIIVNTSP